MGHRNVFRTAIFHIIALQALSLGVVAWADAARGEPGDRPGALRQLSTVNNRVTFRGELKCTLSEANNGQACPLQLKNSETGETLNVSGSSAAMRLFQDGKTQVIATGEINGSHLRIITIRAE